MLKHDICPIFCCGEVLPEREANQHFEVVKKQVTDSLFHLPVASFKNVVIAYEPVWAIGTGKTATPEIAVDAHKIIRAEVAKLLGAAVAANIRILYGGSVKPDNAHALIGQEEIDGGLVGGASLKAPAFARIARFQVEAKA